MTCLAQVCSYHIESFQGEILERWPMLNINMYFYFGIDMDWFKDLVHRIFRSSKFIRFLAGETEKG